MADNTRIFGMRPQWWLGFFIIYTMCLMSVMQIQADEPLKSAVMLTIGFYFRHITEK